MYASLRYTDLDGERRGCCRRSDKQPASTGVTMLRKAAGSHGGRQSDD